MLYRHWLLVIALLGINFCYARQAYANSNTEALARQAVSDNLSVSGPAIDALRAMRAAGLNVLFDVFHDEIERHARDTNVSQADATEWRRISAALDAVSQQRDSYMSRLYWYTDIEEAKTEARKSGKPILSLRLLGKLTDEFSCANSRFFRTALYSNPAINAYLRDNFILHWKSVRPVPRVTIDYGDGRKLERTLTGNSIHYILDAEGRPVDALPGLYGPGAFLNGLAKAETVVKECAGKDDASRALILSGYHANSIKAINTNWLADIKSTGGKVPPRTEARLSGTGPPSATEAGVGAVTKAVVELDIVASVTADTRALGALTDLAAWEKIAMLHAEDARLDHTSVALIRRQTPYARELADRPASQLMANGKLSPIVLNFERYMALDTVRNEYTLHTRLHALLMSGRFDRNLEALNERVYAELFLTPSSDPWLGLFSPDTYTALENGGIVK